jgi:hypothetical protein
MDNKPEGADRGDAGFEDYSSLSGITAEKCASQQASSYSGSAGNALAVCNGRVKGKKRGVAHAAGQERIKDI